MSKWKKFRALSPSERSVFLVASIALPATALALRIIRLRHWLWLISSLKWNPFANRLLGLSHLQQAQRTACLVSAAARNGICRPNCLERSVVLLWLLENGNIEGVIRFGASKNRQQLDAHAWVEYQGVVLNDDSDVQTRFGIFTHGSGLSGTD